MARRPTTDLTFAHSRILKAVALLSEERGHASVADLVEELNFAGDTSITATLKIMERNGFIRIHGGGKRGRRRTIFLTTQGKATLGLGGLRVLGGIPAGPLMEVIDQCETVIDGAELLPHKAGDFLLVVQGDSMIGDGILPNDMVLLRPYVPVRDREIAAVQIGEEYLVTLKHVYFGRDRSKVTLRASNPEYKDIVVSLKDLKVAGVFRGLVRVA